jgi:hypothetical protein
MLTKKEYKPFMRVLCDGVKGKLVNNLKHGWCFQPDCTDDLYKINKNNNIERA